MSEDDDDIWSNLNPNCKLTKTRCEFICENLRRGNYITTCCRAVGIHPSTFNEWKKKGEKGIEPYATFLERVTQAEAEGELKAMKVIDEVADSGNWLASAWKLERKYPQRFGKRERMEIGSDEDFKIEISSKKSPYKMAEEERKLLEEDG